MKSISDNKLILGGKIINAFMREGKKFIPITDGLAKKSYRDWNSLMPVLENIETNEDFYIIHSTYFNKSNVMIKAENQRKFKEINIYYGKDQNIKTRLEATYKAVIEFIKWYNENK